VNSDRTAAAYDIVAASYEAKFVGELEDKPRDRELLDNLASRGVGAVLDVGCGPGQIGAYLAHHGRTVFGVDLSENMTRLASSRLSGAVVADMRALPLRTGSVSDIVSFYSVIHLPKAELGAALREFTRVLQPGGHALVSAHEGEGPIEITQFLSHKVDLAATFFSLDDLVSTAVDAGLEIVVADSRQPYDKEGPTVRLYVDAAKPTIRNCPPSECWLHPAIDVRSSAIEGKGLFATATIEIGEIVSVLGGTVISNDELRVLIAARDANPSLPFVDSITLDDERNLLLSAGSANRYGNHSCDPNTWWVDAFTLVARRPLNPGSEVTNDYATSTGHPDWTMTCRCGTDLCRGVVTGDDWRRPELQDRYGLHWVPVLLDRIQNSGC
jgi:uncharacterized protein